MIALVVTMVNSLDAIDRSVSINLTGDNAIQIDIGDLSTLTLSASGTWSGSIVLQGSVGGDTWNNLQIYDLSDNSSVSSITIPGLYQASVVGFSQIQIVPSLVSGTSLVEILASRYSSITTSSGSSGSGYLTYRNTALSNTAVQVKNSGGSVMGWNFINVNSVTVYVKFYNLASNITVGTSPVLLTQAVPGGSASNPGINFLEAGLIPQEVFSTGISIACVTGLADNSTTAPTTPIHGSVRYK